MKANIAVYQVLAGDANVTAGVNGIYPQLAKEGTALPYITIMPTEFDPTHTKDGGSTIDYENVYVQVNSADLRTMKDIADDVRAALDGYSGTVTTADESIIITRTILVDSNFYTEHEANRTVYVQELEFRLRERRTADY